MSRYGVGAYGAGEYAGRAPLPAAAGESEGLSSTGIAFLVCDLRSGQVLDELPLTASELSDTVAREESQTFTLNVYDEACPDDWSTLVVPGRSMLVALNEAGNPVIGWAVVGLGVEGPQVSISCATLEHCLARTNVATVEAYQIDEGELARRVAAKMADTHGFTIRASNTGQIRDAAYYAEYEDRSIYDALSELMATKGGPEWHIALEWVDTTRQHLRKVIEIAARIGIDRPDAVFEMAADGLGNIATYTRNIDYTSDRGATRVIGTSEGAGDPRPMSQPYTSALATQADLPWPIWEARPNITGLDEPDILNPDAELERRAQAELDRRARGARTWALVGTNDAPRPVLDFNAGDTIHVDIAPQGKRDPEGGVFSARVVAWSWDLTTGAVTPLVWEDQSGNQVLNMDPRMRPRRSVADIWEAIRVTDAKHDAKATAPRALANTQVEPGVGFETWKIATDTAVDQHGVDLTQLNTDLAALDSELTTAQGQVAQLNTDLAATNVELDAVLPITETKIADDAITTPKIAANAVTAGEIAAGAITTAKLAAGAVTANEIAAGAITTEKLAAGAVTANEIGAGAITTAKLDAGAVTANEIAAGAIATNHMTSNTINADRLLAGTLTVDKLSLGATTPSGLLKNGGFEDTYWDGVRVEPVGWTPQNGVGHNGQFVGANVIQGQTSMSLFSQTVASPMGAMLSDTFSVVGSEDYVVDGYLRTLTATSWTTSPTVLIEWLNSSNTLISSWTCKSADWNNAGVQAFREIVTAPSTATKARIRCTAGHKTTTEVETVFDGLRVLTASELSTGRYPDQRAVIDGAFHELQLFPANVADRLLAGRVAIEQNWGPPGTGWGLTLTPPDSTAYVLASGAGLQAVKVVGGGNDPLDLEPTYGIRTPKVQSITGALTLAGANGKVAMTGELAAQMPHAIAWKTAAFSRTPGQNVKLGWEDANLYYGFTISNNDFITPEDGAWLIQATVSGSWDQWPCWIEVQVNGVIVDGPQQGDNQSGNRAIVAGVVARCAAGSTIGIYLGLHGSATVGFTGQTGRPNTNVEIVKVGAL